MAEDFAFNQILGDRGAIDGDEGAGLARGNPMHSLRGQFLAGAAFTGDKDGRARCGGIFQNAIDRLHGGGGANEAGKALARRTRCQHRDLPAKRGALHHIGHRHGQPFRREGLYQKIGSARLHRFYRQRHRTMRRHHHHGQIRIAPAQFAQHGKPIPIRQA